MSEHRHRSGDLHQQNKGFKAGKHDSKGAIKRRAQGKIETNGPRQSIKNLAIVNNKDAMKQKHQKLVKSKKNELLERKRLGLPDQVAPRVVTIIKLSESCNTKKVKEMLLQKFKLNINTGEMEMDDEEQNNDGNSSNNTNGYSTISLTSKVRMMLLECQTMAYDQVIEYCKLSDIILFVIDANQPKLNSEAERIFTIVKAQSVPTVIEIIQNFDQTPIKKRNELKKSIQSVFHFHFPNEPKVLPMDTNDECSQVLRYIENIHVNEIIWRKVRPYLLIEKSTYIPETKVVTIDGFIRGNNLSAKQIIHIPDYGDFQIEKIELIDDPHIRKKSYYTNGNGGGSDMDQDKKINTLDKFDQKDRDTLQTWNVPDPMDNEQALPTAEEMKEIEANKKKKLVPKGTSGYQSSWYLDNESGDEEEENFENEDLDMNDNEMGEEEQEEMGEEEQEIEGEEEQEEQEELEEVKESNKWKGIKHKSQITDELLKDSDDDDDDDDENKEESESEDEEERKQLQQDEILYPDEVDTPGNVPSRIRFSKFRGLKSFRSSPWDVKENLPIDYAKIFQFHSFNQSMRASISILENAPAKPDMYVRIHLVNGPKELVESTITINKPDVAVGLYRYENKISLLHFSVEKHKSYEETVKSKEEVYFHFGWRKFSTSPIYSISSPNCDKQKFEKFLLPARNTMATIYGPITYPPAPLLIFNGKDCNELVATGYLSSVNPDRIICKRIILTGVIAKSISKKFVTVKDMFYYPEDINWFKKVELHTKMGRVGHIKEPLGTHGRMKCQFDGTMNQQDTVCMNLYKRVYPRWIKDDSPLLKLE
ncbi:hypothetical protein ACTA71_005693 [Dictyostelium dimigraforme]